MKAESKIKNSSTKASLLLMAGAVVVAPLLLTTASAGLDSGHFMVKAHSNDNPTIHAYAGLEGVHSPDETPGSGGNIDGDTGEEINPGATVFSMSCGPMTLNITEQTLAYSKIAEDLMKEGREDEIIPNPEGWEMITSTDGLEVYNGMPPETDPITVVLGTAPLNGMVAMATTQGDGSCTILDTRGKPETGKSIKYESRDSGSTYSETRYIEEENQLRVVNAFKHSVGVSLSRSLNKDRDDNVKSDRYPDHILLYTNGGVDANVYPLQPIDGAEGIKMHLEADGSGSVEYTGGNDNSTTPNRRNAPVQVKWNSSKEFTGLAYADNNGLQRALPEQDTPYTVEDYNRITGQHWDGKYHTPNDFDVTFPFEPTSP